MDNKSNGNDYLDSGCVAMAIHAHNFGSVNVVRHNARKESGVIRIRCR